jgi:hypothetical protein
MTDSGYDYIYGYADPWTEPDWEGVQEDENEADLPMTTIVKVKIAVSVDTNGEWSAAGWSGADLSELHRYTVDDLQRGALLVRAVANRRTTQWRNELATGNNMMDAWMRLSWGGER